MQFAHFARACRQSIRPNQSQFIGRHRRSTEFALSGRWFKVSRPTSIIPKAGFSGLLKRALKRFCSFPEREAVVEIAKRTEFNSPTSAAMSARYDSGEP